MVADGHEYTLRDLSGHTASTVSTLCLVGDYAMAFDGGGVVCEVSFLFQSCRKVQAAEFETEPW